MRSRLLMFLLLLWILVHDAQGRKLISKGSLPEADGLHSLHHEEPQGMKSVDESQSKKWSGSFRKLTMIHISSTTTNISKNDKNGEMKGDTKSEELVSKIGRKEESLSVNSSSKTKPQQQVQDIVGINEMDYTLARRKPPIHN